MAAIVNCNNPVERLHTLDLTGNFLYKHSGL
jgi:hypothetical protein